MKNNTVYASVDVPDRSLSALAGNRNGRADYAKFAEKLFRDSDLKDVTVLFPDNIEAISISYVQGFCDSLVKKYGKQYVFDNLSVKAKTESLAERFKRNILV